MGEAGGSAPHVLREGPALAAPADPRQEGRGDGRRHGDEGVSGLTRLLLPTEGAEGS